MQVLKVTRESSDVKAPEYLCACNLASSSIRRREVKRRPLRRTRCDKSQENLLLEL